MAPKRQIPTKKPTVQKQNLGKTGINFYGDHNSLIVKNQDMMNITQNNFNIKLDPNMRQRKFESRDGNSFYNPQSQKMTIPAKRATQQNFFENPHHQQQRMYNSVIHHHNVNHFHNRSDYSMDLVSKVNQKAPNNFITVNKKNVTVISQQNAQNSGGSHQAKTQ